MQASVEAPVIRPAHPASGQLLLEVGLLEGVAVALVHQRLAVGRRQLRDDLPLRCALRQVLGRVLHPDHGHVVGAGAVHEPADGGDDPVALERVGDDAVLDVDHEQGGARTVLQCGHGILLRSGCASEPTLGRTTDGFRRTDTGRRGGLITIGGDPEPPPPGCRCAGHDLGREPAAGPVARDGAWAEWAPSGRTAVPFIVLLVIVANLVGVGTVVLLLVGVDDGSGGSGRTEVLWTAAAYLVVALPAGTAAGLRRQRATNRWLTDRREPTPAEAGHALRLPLDTALVAGSIWLAGALLTAAVAASPSRSRCVGLRVGVAVAARRRRHRRCHLPAHRPRGPGGDRARPGGAPAGGRAGPRRAAAPAADLGADQRRAAARRRPAVPRPQQPRRARGSGSVLFLVVVALLVGALATLLTARAVGQPLRDLRRAVQQVGRGDYDVEVLVDDAGEIGLLQEGVNTMAAGLAERERLRDLFGRHVGTTVAQEALRTGVSLGGEERTVAALFVDIAGSTSLVRRTGPEEMVGLLNRFFAVVVETVEDEGGLVNKFEGDAALCVFGAPADHPDPAGAALRAARLICDAVAAAGEVDVGVGVACGRVWAGQVGAASRLEYTVIGDPVNEAARLTELAKDHPGRAVASEPTVRAADPGERGHWVRDAAVELRGRGEPRAPGCAGPPERAGRRPGQACDSGWVGGRLALPGSWALTTTRTSSGWRVPISGSSKRSVRPPRVTDRTMSRRSRGPRPTSLAWTTRWCRSRPCPPVTRSSTTATTRGESVERPSSRPEVAEVVMTVSAPDWRSRLAFSSSRTLVVIGTLGFSCRTVRVMRTAASSRFAATMTARARSTEARRSTSVRPASPMIPVRPSELASSIARGSGSTTTILSGGVPLAMSERMALRPLVP